MYNSKDAIIQSHFPTLMVPKYGSLESCGMNRTRLLMARDGLFLETRQPWGVLRELLWHSGRPLPYGEVQEIDTFADAFKSSVPLLQEMWGQASLCADGEWAGWVVFDNGSFRYQPLEFEATAASAEVKYPELPEDVSLAIDVHSHGAMPAFFSGTDDSDDRGGVRICVVFGKYEKNSGRLTEAVVRYAVEGIFIDREWEEFI